MDYVTYYVVGSGGSNDTYPGTDYSAHQVNDSGGGGNGTYVVQAGDTLSGIAAQMGTTVEYLATANGIENPDLLYVGQVLRY